LIKFIHDLIILTNNPPNIKLKQPRSYCSSLSLSLYIYIYIYIYGNKYKSDPSYGSSSFIYLFKVDPQELISDPPATNEKLWWYPWRSYRTKRGTKAQKARPCKPQDRLLSCSPGSWIWRKQASEYTHFIVNLFNRNHTS